MRKSNERIKVLQVVNSLDIGGLEKVVLNLIKENATSEKIEMCLLCLEERGALHAELPPGIKHFQMHKTRVRQLYLIYKFYSIILKEKISVIHAHNYAPLFFSVIVKIFLLGRVKIIYTEHNQIYNISRKHYRRFPYLLKFVDEIITVSKNLQEYFNEHKLGKNSTVIWNGIRMPLYNERRVKELSSQYRSSNDDFLIGTAVVMSKQKGLTYLIEAAKNIVKKNSNIKFVLIGDGPLKREHEKQVHKLGLSDNFIFPGYQKDIPNHLKSLDLFIMPSLWEGFSIALLEANALGIPIITTDVGGNSEIIKNETNGLLVPAENPEALVKGIMTLFLDKSLREQFAENGQKLFKKNFEVKKMVEKYNDTYRKLMQTN